MTYTPNLIEIARLVYLQNFDRDLSPLEFTLPHLGISAASQWITRWVVARRNLHRPRKQTLAAANLTQSGQALLPEQRSQVIQRLRRSESQRNNPSQVREKQHLVHHVNECLSIFLI